ncbi:MAG: phospho-N-acetylmuramoyl-pentapeptide-transferase [Armatimonadetes bacterium]|nr:phospho-N-acetylmuramoyl-pentapeptide-transferase [Armatimonadota bacterium]
MLSFNNLLSFSGAFLICFLSLPLFIKLFHKISLGQNIRSEGPVNHQIKSGTPTMGGIVIILSIIFAVLLVPQKKGEVFWVVLGIIFLNTLIGFLDDWICYKKKRSLGLRARDKLFFQTIIGIVSAYYFWPANKASFFHLEGIIIYFSLVVLVILSTANSVNLTDGLDGLSIGLVIITVGAYIIIIKDYQLAVLIWAILGASLAFLWYNFHPAKIFMGDVGALGLGGAIGALSLASKTEFLLLILGGVFVLETISVILQVIYFKLTKGRRIFKMSPLHHHFELSGWEETQVVIRFWIIGIILAVFALYIHYFLNWSRV